MKLKEAVEQVLGDTTSAKASTKTGINISTLMLLKESNNGRLSNVITFFEKFGYTVNFTATKGDEVIKIK